MELREEQIAELWKQKLQLYFNRENERARSTIFLSLIFMFGVAGVTQFDRKNILNMSIFYGIYFLVVSILNKLIKHYKSTKYRRKKNFYTLPSLLRFIQDWNLFFMLFITNWVIWTHALGTIIDRQQIGRFSFFLFTGILILSSLLSPAVLRKKIASLKDQSFKYYAQGSILATSLPGILLFLITVIPNIKGISTSTLIIILTSFLFWAIMLPLLIWSGYEILVLSLNKWPNVKENGMNFTVSYVDDEDI